jgi:hypothetical protein
MQFQSCHHVPFVAASGCTLHAHVGEDSQAFCTQVPLASHVHDDPPKTLATNVLYRLDLGTQFHPQGRPMARARTGSPWANRPCALPATSELAARATASKT